MGTLFQQLNRSKYDNEEYNINSLIADLKDLEENEGFTKDQAIEFLKVAQLRRRNNLYRNNGDAWDEQIAGIGEILQSISNSLNIIADKMNDNI